MGRFVKEETRRYVRLLARVSSMGIAMGLSIVIGLGAGYYFDKFLGTHPWGFFVGLGMGHSGRVSQTFTLSSSVPS